MTVSARQLNRATLERQCLLRRAPVDVVEAVHRVMALQAQEPASPYVALWNRVADFDPSSTRRGIRRPFDRQDDADAGHPSRRRRDRLPALPRGDATRPFVLRACATTAVHEGRAVDPGRHDALLHDAVAFTAEPRAPMPRWRRGSTSGSASSRSRASGGRCARSGRSFTHPTGGPWSFGPRPPYMAAPAQDRPGDPHASLQ